MSLRYKILSIIIKLFLNKWIRSDIRKAILYYASKEYGGHSGEVYLRGLADIFQEAVE